MAIRNIVAGDVATLQTWWDAHRAGSAEFTREASLAASWLAQLRATPGVIGLIDPATQTFALGVVDGSVGIVILTLTRSAGAAAITAADRINKAICNRAITAGLTSLHGEYTFPAGVDPDTTRAVIYFNVFVPPGVKTVTVNPDGTKKVAFDVAPAAWLSALTARTP